MRSVLFLALHMDTHHLVGHFASGLLCAVPLVGLARTITPNQNRTFSCAKSGFIPAFQYSGPICRLGEALEKGFGNIKRVEQAIFHLLFST